MQLSRTQSFSSKHSKVTFHPEDAPNNLRDGKLKPPLTHSALKLTSTANYETINEVISDEKRPTFTSRVFIDDIDYSCHPSYTNFKPPYEVVCQHRYQKKAQKYSRQFRRELKKLEAMQPSAYEALRFNRIFSITTLWPPLHTRKEIEYVLRNFYKVPRKQQERINYLLKEKQI